MKHKNPEPGGTQDPRALRLLALQDELDLTAFQRRFVEALAVDPKRNQTKAAVAAGAPRKGATVQASRLLRLVKVQKYFHALTTEAEGLRSQATEAAVADLSETLMTLTAQMRVRAGDYIIPLPQGGFAVDVEAVKNARPGVITAVSHDHAGEPILKLADSLAAAKALLMHYKGKPPENGGNVTINPVLANLPPGVATAVFRAMALASGPQPPRASEAAE